MARQCKARTKSGSKCNAAASADGFCFIHSPNRTAERAAARKLGGFNRRATARVSGEAVQIESLADVLKLVNAVILDTWELENSPARNRVLLGCADAAIRALQSSELETRLAAIEAALKMGELNHGNQRSTN